MSPRGAIQGVAVLALAALAVVFVVRSGADGGHRFSVTVPEATNVVKGQLIREAGVQVGEITAIHPANKGADARLDIELEDRAWPLPKGSKLALKWGGTANFGNRYVTLTRGAGGGSMVSDGGKLPPQAFSVPAEFDEFLGTFDAGTRAQTRRLLDNAGPALRAAKPGLRAALTTAPPALDEASYVLGDLDADHRALQTLVRSTDDVVGAVDAAQPGVRELLDGAATTFDAIADESTGLEQGLDRGPTTLRTLRSTLHRADPVLDDARELTDRLKPGVAELRRTAAPLNSVLRTVRQIGPDATDTLRTARGAVPDVNPLLGELADRAPQLKSIGEQAVDNLKCLRPYTPEAMAFFSNWGDYFNGSDGKDKLIRAQVQAFAPAFTNATGYNSAQAAQLFSGLEYGFPRPPGTEAGQPWFLPECGAGPDALDPQKDPEIRNSEKAFMPKLTPIVPVPAEGRG